MGGENLRFSVTYKVECLPLQYRMKVYSLIKEAVKISDNDYYKELFIRSKNDIKPFSFSTFLLDFKIMENKINLKELSITISSSMEFALHAFNGLKQLKTYEIEGIYLKQTNIRILKEAVITTNNVCFKTLSPILIEDSDGNPLAPNDDNYEKELNYFANLQVQRAAQRDLYQQLRFTPIRMSKQVIKESNRMFNESHKNSSLFFTTYKGVFKLEGHPEDLQILYQYGIGKRTAFFGLVEYEGEVM